MTADLVRPVTCLGCGCVCDDLTVRIGGGRIAELSPPCPLATRWFADGVVPGEIRVQDRPAAIEAAISAAAELLVGAARPLVLIAPDLTTEAQRLAIAVGDLLGAAVDGATSGGAARGILAAQRRGRAAATLGEIRNRADVILFWAVDPDANYPRYLERYVDPPSATHVTRRTLISVSVGRDRGPTGAALEAEFEPREEVYALAVMQAVARGRGLGDLPQRLRPALDIAERLRQARYAVIVHDAEGEDGERDAARTESLVALAQVLNGPTRAALSSLRAGGNRSGAEAALTWQTGYPMRVSFDGGYPQYRSARSGLERLMEGDAGAVLVAGAPAAMGLSGTVFERVPGVVIGPGASRLSGSRVAIDTGVAGIHEAGTAYRMDDVPLPVAAPLPTPRAAVDTLSLLLAEILRRPSRRSP